MGSIISDSRRSAVMSRVYASVLIALIAAPLPVVADDAPDLLTDSFSIGLGTFIVESEPTIRIDGDAGPGTPVDFSRDFGEGGDSTRFRLDATWRFGDRHKVRAMWFNNGTSASRVLEEDIIWGDDVYPVSARADLRFDFDIYQLAYEYAFLQRDNYEVTGGIGLHYTKFETSLSAKASTSGGTLDEDITSASDLDAPLPVIGLRGLWRLPHDFWVDAQVQLFALEYENIDGNLQDYRLSVIWQPKTWLGLGVGYNQLSIDVDVDKKRFDGEFDWDYKGPMIFYNASF
jgi:hypothetical protein